MTGASAALPALGYKAPEFGQVVVPPPQTAAEMEKPLCEGDECRDWYLCFRKI